MFKNGVAGCCILQGRPVTGFVYKIYKLAFLTKSSVKIAVVFVKEMYGNYAQLS